MDSQVGPLCGDSEAIASDRFTEGHSSTRIHNTANVSSPPPLTAPSSAKPASIVINSSFSIANLQQLHSPQVKNRPARKIKNGSSHPVVQKLKACPFCKEPFKSRLRTARKLEHIRICPSAADLTAATIHERIQRASKGIRIRPLSDLTIFDSIIGSVGAVKGPEIRVIGVDQPAGELAQVELEIKTTKLAQRRHKLIEMKNPTRPTEFLQGREPVQALASSSTRDLNLHSNPLAEVPPATQPFVRSKLLEKQLNDQKQQSPHFDSTMNPLWSVSRQVGKNTEVFAFPSVNIGSS